ncbi:MAG TPA: YihA family ribosome biogenesis GTP-binding protein [Saprospiraceae bacterium]|nr:YihA family ribosome biogenesis GTP-binding protein [Saprospiraceae bacterium]
MTIIHSANYVASYPSENKCPKDKKPEFAFIGRSNVGKSSLINLLTDRKELAKVSKKPGKTQMINYFLINEQWYLVDLPGYGYAKISKKTRAKWGKMIENYLKHRLYLQCAFILLDANVPPQKIDINFINWMGEQRVPFVIVYTKTDRLQNKIQLNKNIEAIQNELLKYWNELPQQFISSATKRKGKDEILDFIDEVVTKYLKNR